MTTVATRMRALANFEGFDVSMLDDRDQPVPDNTNGYVAYSYNNRARGDMTVSEWRAARFRATYGHEHVAVWYGNGQPAHGNAKLENVRKSYEEGEVPPPEDGA